MPGSGGQARRAASNISVPPDALQRRLQRAPTDEGERLDVPGRKGRRLKATRYPNGWSLDVAIVLAGQTKARAAITLDVDQVRELAARFDDLADEMERLREVWHAENEAEAA